MKNNILILLITLYGAGLYGQIDSVKASGQDTIDLKYYPDTLIVREKPDTITLIKRDTIILVETDTMYITEDFFVLDTLYWNKMMKKLDDTTRNAIEYLKSYYMNKKIWKEANDPLRHAFFRIAYYLVNSPVDTTIKFLESYPYNNLNYIVSPDDTVSLLKVQSMVDSSMQTHFDTIISGRLLNIGDTKDSLTSDTLIFQSIDSTIIHKGDSLRIYLVDTLDIPFTEITTESVGDSLKYAVNVLVEEIKKDSMLVWLKNLANDSTDVWVNKKGKSFTRFWLKNEVMDSIGLWVENVGRKSIKFTLDDGVYFSKFRQNKNIDDFKFEEEPVSDLRDVTPVVVEPVYWKFGAESGINFSQGYLSNWVKGGESSISTLGDFTAFANYTKKKTKWENNFRFTYGVMKTGEKGLRKNEDLWEINSKFGQKAFGKLGRKIMEKTGEESLKDWYYSFLVTLKSQITPGYNYPNDSVIVSSFMSPGNLFFALGLDYKPGKNTSFLISPITSKSTIVRDTVTIDQTKYGLDPDRKIKSEMGGYVKAKLKFNFNEDISLDNKLTLFTNYLDNPQNIDIDWEATLRMKINYYINAIISTHLIYDDDIEVPLFDDEGTKIGSGPRTQFKELISIGFTYKFL